MPGTLVGEDIDTLLDALDVYESDRTSVGIPEFVEAAMKSTSQEAYDRRIQAIKEVRARGGDARELRDTLTLLRAKLVRMRPVAYEPPPPSQSDATKVRPK